MSSTLLRDDAATRQPAETQAATTRGATDRLVAAYDVWTAIGFLAAILLALRGQQLITHREYPLDGPLFFAAAIATFLWSVARTPLAQDVRWSQSARQMRLPLYERAAALIGNVEVRAWLALASVLAAVLAYMGFAGNHFSAVGTTSWVAAIVCFVLATAERPTSDWRASGRGWLARDRWTVSLTRVGLALIAITLVAVFFRAYRLAAIPAEMTSDHAEKLLDVHDVLNGQYRIFFPRNTGREAVQFYLTAALIRFTPLEISHLALKVGTALFGILAVPLTYLLGRELYGRGVGLLAAAFLAISHWHVAIARVGLRFPFTAAFAVPTLYFVFRAFRYNRRNDWLAAGLVLGLGLHTYIPMRIVPLLLVALVLIKAAFDLVERSRGGAVGETSSPAGAFPEASSLTLRFWVNALLGGVASLLVFLPLLRFMRDFPEIFWFRVLSRSSDVERQVATDTWRVFLGNVKNALLMFNYRGDQVWVNTIPGSPALGWVTAALFLLGVAYLFWRLLEYEDRRSVYVMVSLFVLLLPSVMSLAYPGENPSVVRAGGAVPLATLIAALPLYLAARHLHRSFGRNGTLLAGALVAVLLIPAARYNYKWYFVDYDQQFRQAAWNATEMGEVVRAFAESVGDMDHAYHVGYPYWVDTRNIAINAGDITWNNVILDINQVRAQASDPAPKLYLVHPDDQQSLAVLQSTFPGSQVTRYQSKTPGRDFMVVFVPPGLR